MCCCDQKIQEPWKGMIYFIYIISKTAQDPEVLSDQQTSTVFKLSPKRI